MNTSSRTAGFFLASTVRTAFVSLALGILLAPPAAAADWVKVWETTSATGFVDRESITTANNTVGVWVRVVHRSPQVANPTKVRSGRAGQDPKLVARGIIRDPDTGDYYKIPEASIPDWQAAPPVHFLAEMSLHQFDCDRREFRILESSIYSDAQAEKLVLSLDHGQSVKRTATRVFHVHPSSLREIEFNLACARGTTTKPRIAEAAQWREHSALSSTGAHGVGLAAAFLLLPVSLLYALGYIVFRRLRMSPLPPIGIAFSWLLSWGIATLIWKVVRSGDFGLSLHPAVSLAVCGLVSVVAVLLLVVAARPKDMQ